MSAPRSSGRRTRARAGPARVVAALALAPLVVCAAPREASAVEPIPALPPPRSPPGAPEEEVLPGLRAPTVFFGGRTTTTNVQSRGQDATSFGALFVTSASFHGSQGRFGSLRGSFIGAIGSGTATVEGWLRGALTLGGRYQLNEAQSAFLRLGFGGEAQGNGNYYFSRLELPIVEAGWQLGTAERFVEGGLRAAPLLAGSYHVEGPLPRTLSGAGQYGAYFSARTVALRSEISVTYLDKRGDAFDRPVQIARALVCGFGVAQVLVVCLDGQVLRVPNGGAVTADLSGSRVFYSGLTVGVGQTFRPVDE